MIAGSGTAAAASNYYIKYANTGLCLTADQLAGQANSVFTHTCVDAASQKWHIAGGKFTTLGSTGYCLDTYLTWVRNNVFQDRMHSDGGVLDGGVLDGVVPRTCGNESSRWIFVAA